MYCTCAWFFGISSADDSTTCPIAKRSVTVPVAESTLAARRSIVRPLTETLQLSRFARLLSTAVKSSCEAEIPTTTFLESGSMDALVSLILSSARPAQAKAAARISSPLTSRVVEQSIAHLANRRSLFGRNLGAVCDRMSPILGFLDAPVVIQVPILLRDHLQLRAAELIEHRRTIHEGLVDCDLPRDGGVPLLLVKPQRRKRPAHHVSRTAHGDGNRDRVAGVHLTRIGLSGTSRCTGFLFVLLSICHSNQPRSEEHTSELQS